MHAVAPFRHSRGVSTVLQRLCCQHVELDADLVSPAFPSTALRWSHRRSKGLSPRQRHCESPQRTLRSGRQGPSHKTCRPKA